jgi:hypothetical protein
MATKPQVHDPDEPWVPPRVISLSPKVVAYTREFIVSVHEQHSKIWIAGIGWDTSVVVKDSPDAVPRELGPGLSLGAYRREEVPTSFIDRAGDLEFVLHIPREVWEASKQRLIDIDESLLFKLRLL